MNSELNFPPNFERLVLGCIDADFASKYILLHRSDLKISAKNRQHFFAIEYEFPIFFIFFVEFRIFSANF